MWRPTSLLLLVLFVGCVHPVVQTGTASWYGAELRGRPTASGEPFRPSRRTCAHPTLPFGTVLRVERVDTGERVRVVVNDRGPGRKDRVVDLSRAAARRLDLVDAGLGTVELSVVGCKRRYDGARSCAAQR